MSRKAFSFYRSHYEQMKLLEPSQISDVTLAICEVQFLEVNIEDVSFQDKMTQIVWTGIKHALAASVKGYTHKKGISAPPLARGSENVSTPLEQEEEKGEEEEEEKEKEEVQPTRAEEIAQKVADFLYQKIVEYKPNFKGTSTPWVKDIERAVRIDKRSEAELKGCINWIYGSKQGSFWIPNVMSGKKLRDKFDTMEAQMIRDSGNNDPSIEESIALMQKLREERNAQ